MTNLTLGDDSYPGVLKIVTRLICMGASRSYPFLFISHYALLIRMKRDYDDANYVVQVHGMHRDV